MLCDDGTTYKITDLKLWEPPAPLPTPTCDWNQFPELKLPEVQVLRFQSQTGDRLHILNLYETRRMLYTLYNAVPNCRSYGRLEPSSSTLRGTHPTLVYGDYRVQRCANILALAG